MTKNGAKIKVHLLFLPLLWQLPEAKVRLFSRACFALKKSAFAIVFFPLVMFQGITKNGFCSLRIYAKQTTFQAASFIIACIFGDRNDICPSLVS